MLVSDLTGNVSPMRNGVPSGKKPALAQSPSASEAGQGGRRRRAPGAPRAAHLSGREILEGQPSDDSAAAAGSVPGTLSSIDCSQESLQDAQSAPMVYQSAPGVYQGMEEVWGEEEAVSVLEGALCGHPEGLVLALGYASHGGDLEAGSGCTTVPVEDARGRGPGMAADGTSGCAPVASLKSSPGVATRLRMAATRPPPREGPAESERSEQHGGRSPMASQESPPNSELRGVRRRGSPSSLHESSTLVTSPASLECSPDDASPPLALSSPSSDGPPLAGARPKRQRSSFHPKFDGFQLQKCVSR